MSRTSAGPGHPSPDGDRSLLTPDDIIDRLAALDDNLHVEGYYSERSLFYNPGHVAPLGVIFASLKDHDGPNDKSSKLSRPGVFRFAFQMPPEHYHDYFGPPPPRPPKSGVVAYDFDPAETSRVLPHPVYAWMRWVQVLCPTESTFHELQPALEESLETVRAKWTRRSVAR